ncbi:amidohydrolase family protein [Nonomuraea sp. NPDC004186]
MRHDQVVIVEDGRITGITTEVPATVDLGDATLLPGLIDCHVHLAFDASRDVVAMLEPPGLADRMRQAARQHLAAGVTTVRDLGDRDYLALGLDLGLDGPEILSAGPPITTPRGHCWFLGGEAAGEHGVREAVRERAARGVHVIKMMVTGGEMTPGTHSHLLQYGLAELRAAADEAHAHGLPITGHVHCAEGIAHVLDAGFDSIEHCSLRSRWPRAASLTSLSLRLRAPPMSAPRPSRRCRLTGHVRRPASLLESASSVWFVAGARMPTTHAPARISTQPANCGMVGLSPSTAAPSATAPTGVSSSRIAPR